MSPRGLASHRGLRGLGRVLWEASLLGDDCAWGTVAEGLASHKERGGLGRVLWEASPLGDCGANTARASRG